MGQKQISSKIVSLSFVVLAVVFLAAFYVVAWQEPTLPPPQGNVDTPINIGPLAQSKTGIISATQFGDTNETGYNLDLNDKSHLNTLCFGKNDADCKSAWPTAVSKSIVATAQATYNSCGAGIYSNPSCTTPSPGPRATVTWDPQNKFINHPGAGGYVWGYAGGMCTCISQPTASYLTCDPSTTTLVNLFNVAPTLPENVSGIFQLWACVQN